MPIESGFFAAIETSPGIFDRSYTSGEYAKRWAQFISNGVAVDGAGPITTENELTKVVDTMRTSVNIGNGWTEGYFYMITGAIEVPHAIADPTDPRIDRVVIELNLETPTRAHVVKAITGIPSATPVAPTLTRNSQVFQISVGQIYIPPGESTLNNAVITDERTDEAVCGLANVKLGLDSGSINDLSLLITSTFSNLTGTNQKEVNESIDTLIGQKLNLSGGDMDGNIKFLNDGNAIIAGQRIAIHDGDTDTYLEFQADDSFRVIVGGSQKFVVNSLGIAVTNGDIYLTGDNHLICSSRIAQHDGDSNTYIEFLSDTFKVVTGGIEVFRVDTGAIKTDRDIQMINDNHLLCSSRIAEHYVDPDTYILFSAADRFDVVTGGTTRFRVENTGARVLQDLKVDGKIEVGSNGGGDSVIDFYDDNFNAFRSLFWDDSANDWRVEDDSGVVQALYHSGNVDAAVLHAKGAALTSDVTDNTTLRSGSFTNSEITTSENWSNFMFVAVRVGDAGESQIFTIPTDSIDIGFEYTYRGAGGAGVDTKLEFSAANKVQSRSFSGNGLYDVWGIIRK